MATNFRSEVFKLCKKLQLNETAKEIAGIIETMSVVKDSEVVGERASDPRNDFAYLAKHSNTEFLGFVYLDDNIGKIALPHFFDPEHLWPQERTSIERGHKTLIRFAELCLSDISAESKDIAGLMDPYFLHKQVQISEDAEPLLSDDELAVAARAFKNGAAYKALMTANFVKLLQKVDINGLRTLVALLDKEIEKSLGEDVTKDLRDFSMKLHSKFDNMSDVMFALCILMLSLQISLKLSCRLMYRAICGIDLFVLNNDNIINIEKNVGTLVSEYYKVFAQEIHPDFSGSAMGSILLIDCNLPHDEHIHEFGMLVAETLNLVGEFGESAKYSFVTVNDELIPIQKLVKAVLAVGLPVVNDDL